MCTFSPGLSTTLNGLYCIHRRFGSNLWSIGLRIQTLGRHDSPRPETQCHRFLIDPLGYSPMTSPVRNSSTILVRVSTGGETPGCHGSETKTSFTCIGTKGLKITSGVTLRLVETEESVQDFRDYIICITVKFYFICMVRKFT